MFWNLASPSLASINVVKLTVNMKCFEIYINRDVSKNWYEINRKHEMFWNFYNIDISY